MNTSDNPQINLPVKGNLTLVYTLPFITAILILIASVVGLQYNIIVYPTEELVQTFVPNDVVNLFICLPILLGSMWLTWRGKLIGLLCWTGALFFVFYNDTAYVFAMPLNWAFLFHLVLMTLSLYAIIGLVSRIDGKYVQQRLSGKVSEKFAGGVLAGLGILFLLRVIGVIVNALSHGASLAETELAVNISDFITTPAWVIGGVRHLDM